MVEAVEQAQGWGEADTLELLHFHLGSQISAIRASRTRCARPAGSSSSCYKLGATGLKYLDVGGGLGVDYDGSQTNFASSMNYTMQEYANDIVFAIKEICDADEVPHPNIVTESGRAMVAHHSVLVVDVLGVTEFNTQRARSSSPQPAPPLVTNLWETYQGVSQKNVLEGYHDALEYKDEVLQLFNLGHLSLEHRVLCEDLFWAICEKVLMLVRASAHVPEELEGLEKALTDTYFCNFSMFQSLPDAWAIDQLFPICRSTASTRSRRGARCSPTSPATPTARSTRSSTCATSSTCSSCTRVDGQDYYLGIFLVGAYQEILGDLHNLFGDTNTVHVPLSRRRRLRDQARRRRRHRHRGAAVRRLLAERPARPHAQQRRAGAAQEADDDRGEPHAHQSVPPGHDRLHVPRSRVSPPAR